jgi:hypothetical protein
MAFYPVVYGQDSSIIFEDRRTYILVPNLPALLLMSSSTSSSTFHGQQYESWLQQASDTLKPGAKAGVIEEDDKSRQGK